MAGSTVLHAHIDVAGVLRWPKSQLAGMFRSAEGRRLNGDECRDVLLEQLALGRRVLPLGEPCEGFDYSGGACPGHHRGEPEGRSDG